MFCSQWWGDGLRAAPFFPLHYIAVFLRGEARVSLGRNE
nr:MAG TPA: hypothetical protein [Caudoviricetes sp.]